VPIQARVVTLDLSQLEPGQYTVQVQAGRKGEVVASAKQGEPNAALPLTASRTFVLERP